MAKVITNVVLKDGTDEAAFITDVTSNTEVDLKNRIPNTPTLVVLKVEESYLNTLRSHSSVVEVDVPPPIKPSVTYPSIPAKYTVTGKRVTGYEFPSNRSSIDARTCLGLSHYYDTDLMISDDLIGMVGTDTVDDHDLTFRLLNQTYSSTYTGKNVDIVIFEGGSVESAENGSETHPDFDDPDNTGTSRCIKTDWSDLDDSANKQVTNGNMWNSHGLSAASVAAGLVGGFAKKAKIRTVYSSGGDTVIEVIDAIKGWHNAKGANGNATILCTEWSYSSTMHETAIKVEDIDSVTGPTLGTANKPGGGWGSDLTPFVDRNMIPLQMNDPDDGSWHWVITFPRQDQSSALKTAVDGAVDAGVLYITSYSNEGNTAAKEGQSEWNGGYCTTSGTTTEYSLDPYAPDGTWTLLTITKGTTTTTTHYKFKQYGDAGLDKSLVVAAAQFSEKYPILDTYSGRGPGVDIVGRGGYAFCAGDADDPVYQDGNRWTTFGGNSAAAPSIAGKSACMMEEYYTLNGAWPTPDQVKNMLIAESRPNLVDVQTTTWSNVPAASDTDIHPPETYYSPDFGHAKLKGGIEQHIYVTDLAGTPNRQCHWNAKGFNREHTYKERPVSGVLYPRPRKFDLPPQ